MTHDDHVACALHIFEALGAAPSHTLSASHIARDLRCSVAELDGYLELLSTLADRTGGARVIAYREGDEVRLQGDAAHMAPLRLTAGESMALAHVLDALNLDDDLSLRLKQALLMPGFETCDERGARIAGARTFGAFYQTLSEACEDGVRCRILYRAQSDATPTWRTVDPFAVQMCDDNAYLRAWDTDKDSERLYRLDRVHDVELTDDSVEPHDLAADSLKEHFSAMGDEVIVECSAARADTITWAGADTPTPTPDKGERRRLAVRVASKPWLFDQVLAAAGDMKIISPTSLASELIVYARGLSASREPGATAPDTSRPA